ncbi:MAG TPA: hydantoinase/oxoprolinase family protein [Solirubrobacteraceae bacterium]|jgi:N-methylhydantoinase A|nr:hydantoinase/oxoprolinase family protein [Solirubrobacteraceae bacterium]
MLLGIDVGGTFTDAVLVGAGAPLHTAKVPSTPADQSLAVLDAVRLVLERAGAEARQVERFAHGMTVATNALLEGRTARTALIATEGFTDVIELGRQARPHLYELCRSAPAPLVPPELRFAAPERMTPEGPLRALDREAARSLIAEIESSRPEAIAVALLHSYADPTHELILGEEIAKLLADVQLTLSSDLVGTFREYERTATTVLDAALSPLLGSYLRRLSDDASAGGLPEPQIMQSSGGLTTSARAAEHAALTVLSGPAGGVGGALLLAELAGEPDVLCFDMGGTSCDVCLIEDSRVAETAEREIAGRPLSLPALDIHTVGAGGGSVAWRDSGGALRVGPASAGAVPGPACYGRGGQLATVTDANLLLGRLLEDSPLAGEIELDRTAAETAISALAREHDLDVLACAEGIVRVAESEMLGALRLMTVERGIDPRGFALMPFGGAGPLHAAALAAGLGMSRILCPGVSGVLCALGLAAGTPRRDVSRTVMLAGSSFSPERLQRERASLLAEASAALGERPSRVRVRHELRYRGQSFELPVEEPGSPDPEALRAVFAAAHEQRYGYRDDSADVELVTVRVSVWGQSPSLQARSAGEGGPPRGETHRVVLGGEPIEAQVLRGELAPGTRLEGPALCAMPEATLLIAPGWAGEVDASGSAQLHRITP